MNPKNYLIVTLGSASLLMAALFYSSIGVGDYTGSQTRTGGFLEKDYAPTEQQEVFSTSLFDDFDGQAVYEQYYDIVVIGDSFSRGPHISWLNFLARDLQARAAFYHIDKLDIPALLDQPLFQNSPPKHLIVQSSEGKTFVRLSRLRRLADLDPLPQVGPAAEAHQKFDVEMIKAKLTKPVNRETALGITAHYFRKAARRAVLGDRGAVTLSVPIDCTSCFSHRQNSSMLIGARRLDRLAYKFNLRNQAAQGVRALRSVVEANQRTQVHTLIFPNKLNVYSRYTQLERVPTIFDHRLPEDELRLIPVREALIRAVDCGVTDVYAPHDHHATIVGYGIAAAQVRSVLLNQTVSQADLMSCDIAYSPGPATG